ncbi:glyoxylase-like metal-dependent hydrolase (beta-lactamase superfamily II) [Pullulanibacillus pueri]|uniref:Hydroxyacylglutathione hydrolase n=1 Tax=Pullulanibacillus pueri TaxID=1437324 RepID=A0A8J2ZVA6_9BACL|nr:MBL fold metallo-hydrolase [Pullulanibacillus pueri]MBM7681546.1 glyoxylase-like metal-dependent hydrolase (beta-lactamase superfamily II) [Pullulanibacillus pueri]GGH79726.1 hydroxyacylglutathione hydrolase [Pullulanibacillus pueri]
MKWTQMPLGAIQTNAYILENDNKEALIIDPGAEAEKVMTFIKDHALKPLAILLTHAHFDHIGALEAIRNTLHLPVYLHAHEQEWLSDPEKNGSTLFPMVEACRCQPAEHVLTEEQNLQIGNFNCRVLETPGHSPGSVAYYFDDDAVVFSGDALFYGSIGRTDLYGGDQDVLIQSINDKLFSLPSHTVVAPGHGMETTIGYEKQTNPFLV